MRTLLVALAVSSVAVGCNYGKRNAKACEDWIESMDESFAGSECEGTDFSSLILGGCEAYEDSKCDISEYFVCLEENTTCGEESGVVNTEGWDNCTTLASCE